MDILKSYYCAKEISILSKNRELPNMWEKWVIRAKILEYLFGISTLFQICLDNESEKTDMLLRDDLFLTGIDINATDDQGMTVLMRSVLNGNNKLVKTLLAMPGIDVNKKNHLIGKTALHLAAQNGYDDCVEILCKDDNINLNEVTDYGYNGYKYTALMIACLRGHHKCVEVLCRIPGIDINKNTGTTALILACKEDHDKCVEILCDHPNIKLYERNSHGKDAFDLALIYYSFSCVGILHPIVFPD
jgi:ankyrin repeat protein